MPTRYLKPGIRDSETIDRLSPVAECLFYRLLVTVDDFGRYDARPAMIRSACYPIRESMTAAKCEELLKELERCGLVYIYAHDGKPFLQMCKWDNMPRAKESKYPPMSDVCIHVYTDVQQPHADVPLTETETVTVTETKGTNVPVGKAALPACEMQSVVDLYHQALPELPAVRLMNDSRKRAIAAMWKFVLTSKKSDNTPRATTSAEAKEWLKGYFLRARENDFLMGRSSKANGHEGWVCDFDFLLSEKGKKHVIEKTQVAA